MKRIFTLFIGLFIAAALNAQPCSPDAQYTSPGIYPDTVTNLPPASIGVAYSGLITAVVPTDTVIFSFSAQIDSINVKSITGLPSGFTWQGHPAGVSNPVAIPGGSSGCVIITGTPTAGQEGVYPLKIFVEAYGKAMGMPMSYPDTVKGYKIIIGTAGIENNDNNNSFSVLGSFPNPTVNVANIVVSNNEPANITIAITDMIGRTVAYSSHKIYAGKNSIELNVADLPEGAYFYTVTKGKESITKKLIINR